MLNEIHGHVSDVEELCVNLYNNSSKRMESTFSQGIKLAKEMERLEKDGEDKWKVMSGVWVEMLPYAAGS